MTFLPIVERELRVASRGKAAWGIRFIAVAVGLFVFVAVWATTVRFASPVQMSKVIFHTMSWVAFAYALLVGAFTTADSVSEERREGTLGLLFLTDLKGVDVVLGKMVATSLHAFYGLLAIFPIMAIPLLMGGVDREQMFKALLALLNTMFLSLAVGMVISVHGRDERRVAGTTAAVMLFLAGGVPLLSGLAHEWLEDMSGMRAAGYHDTALLGMLASPGVALSFALFGQSGFPWPEGYWSAMAVNHLMALGCLLLACRRMRNAWKDRPATSRRMVWRDRWKRWCHGSGDERVAYRKQLLEQNPFYWLAARDRLTPSLVWGSLGLVGLIWVWAAIENGGGLFEPQFGVFFCYPTHVGLKLWMIGEACSRLGPDRRSGALELILSTPVKTEDILKGHWRALHRTFLGPTIVMLLVEFTYMFSEDDGEWVAMVLIYMATSALDYWAIGWAGMWASLNSKKQHTAARSVVSKVLFLPWLVWIFLMMGGGGSSGAEGPIAIWGLLSMMAAAGFGGYALTQLKEQFRDVATRAVGGK